jgi:nitrite reductase/ring-hydroxylating ferredoxin subunit
MMTTVVSHKAVYGTLILAMASILSGCFEGQSGSNPEAIAASSAALQPQTGVNQAPEINGVPVATIESGQTYTFAPSAKDADNDFLEFQVVNKPQWAQFDNETGLLSGTPQDSDVGETADITIEVTDGRDHRAIGPFRIRVAERGSTTAGGNTPPIITGTAASSVQVGSTYHFAPSASDVDGERLTFVISNRPSWAAFNSTTGVFTGVPAAANAGIYSNIVVSVTDGLTTISLPPFSIQVNDGANRLPTLSGEASATVKVSQTYSFKPAAIDADGDNLTYAIQNKPSWATFDASTGRLQGTPAASHVGTFGNVIISVSDGKASTSLPAFTIGVVAPGRQALTNPVVRGGANATPTISGSPVTSVLVGSAYNFQPLAKDTDGDTLTWSIENKPSWATFSTTTGRLIGKPASGNAGSFKNIVVTVTDGKSSASLAPFSIAVGNKQLADVSGSASLSWVAPTENIDGSPLGNLAGYRIMYGNSKTSLTQMVELPNDSAGSYTIAPLTSGSWYFAVKAYTSSGAESALSAIASKTIP